MMFILLILVALLFYYLGWRRSEFYHMINDQHDSQPEGKELHVDRKRKPWEKRWMFILHRRS